MVSNFSALLNIVVWGEADDFGRSRIYANVLNNISAANPANDRLGVVIEVSSDNSNNAYLVTGQEVYEIWRRRDKLQIDSNLTKNAHSLEADVRPAHISPVLLDRIRDFAGDGIANT